MRVRRAMWAAVLGALGLGLAGCPAVAPADSCRRDDECPAAYRCVQGLCARRAPDASSAEASALDAPRLDGARDAAAPDRAVADLAVAEAATSDSAQADGAALDASHSDTAVVDATPDGAAADLAPPDLVGGSDTSTAADGAQLDLATPDTVGPDLGAPDTAVPDTAVPDTLAPDLSAPPDTASPPDTCVPDAGAFCPRNDFCGATLDCQGNCVGGTAKPACPDCGVRTCQNLQTWSGCLGGSCSSYSQCNAQTGSCECVVDNCQGLYCYGNDLYCDIDAYGCHYDTLVEECLDGSTCDDRSESCVPPSGCGAENCAGCCSRDGVCLDGWSNYACGGSGSLCQDCSTYGDGCQFWDCTQNRECEVYSPVANGTPCGPGAQCWSGICTVCDVLTGSPCGVACNCNGSTSWFPGTILCSGYCALPPGCSCSQACQGPC